MGDLLGRPHAADALTVGQVRAARTADAEAAEALEAWRAFCDDNDGVDQVDAVDVYELPDLDVAAVAGPWLARAACSGLPPDGWFPEREEGESNQGHEARRICAGCPVWRECLTGAVERREQTGIWGGAGGSALRGLRRAFVAGGEVWEAALVDHRHRLDAMVDESTVYRPPVHQFVDRATHGVIGTYARGCRCPGCTWAAAARTCSWIRECAA